MTEENDADPGRTMAAGLWQEHLPLLVTISSGFYIAIRILSAAGFDPEAAFAILSSGGAATVILGAALSSVGLVSLAIFGVCAERQIFHPEINGNQRQWNMMAAIVFGIIAIFTAPGFAIAFLVLIVVLYFIVAYILQPAIKWLFGYPTYEEERTAIRNALLIQDKNMIERVLGNPEKRQMSIARSRRNSVVVLSVWIAINAIFTPPWMPAEELTIQGGPPIVAYVVTSDSSDFVVLLVTTRQIKYVSASSVVGQQICDAGGWPPPLPDLLPIRPKYPPCPFSAHPSEKRRARPRAHP